MKSVFENVYNSIFSMDFFSPTKFDNKLMSNNFQIKAQFDKYADSTYYSIGIESGLINVIKNTILNSIKEIDNIEFIDLRKGEFDVNYFIYKMDKHDKMMVPYEILSKINKESNFIGYYNAKSNNQKMPFGNLSGVDIWCESDPAFGKIIITTCNPLNIDIDIRFSTDEDPKFDNILVDMNVDKNIDFKIWYLIESENDENFDKFIQWNRDKKIKTLID